MALNLVNYDASDNESDEEMDQSSPATVAVIPKVNIQASGGVKKATNEDDDIPKPSEKELKLAELAKKEKANIIQTNLLTTFGQKKNGKVLIGIPSLADLEEEEHVKKSKKRDVVLQQGQSKLFIKLPPPRNSSYESPVENTSKPAQPVPIKKSTPLIPQAVTRKQASKKDSDDEDDSGSFFTMDEPALKAHDEPVLFPASQIPLTSNYEEAFYAMPTNEQYNMAGNPDMPVSDEPVQMELDDVALQALQGSSGTKRKLPDDAHIIEVKQERLTYDPQMSYLKAISEEKTRGPEITYNKLQKKKHQITYLAAQAKAREVDLKNQWAQNKSTKRQTQAKYGF